MNIDSINESEKRVLLLGGKSELVEKASSLGLKVIWLRDHTQEDKPNLELAEHTIVTDLNHEEIVLGIADMLYRIKPFKTALSISEDTLLIAAKIREELMLPGVGLYCTMLLKKKNMMRKYLNENDFSPVKNKMGKELIDIEEFLNECQGPIIAKPLAAAGSLCVFKIENMHDATCAMNKFNECSINLFLMEEYLEGVEISVEAFSFNGKHIVISITDKIINENHVELGHTTPSQLSATTQNEIIKFTQDFLNVINLEDGPTHTEIKITPNGLRIIESHNRVGGDHINDLVNLAFGIDMRKMAFAWAYGLIEPFTESPTPKSAAGIRYFNPKPGEVRTILGIEALSKTKECYEYELNLKPGDIVKPLISSLDRPGYFIVRGENSHHVHQIAERLKQQIEIIVN